VVAVVDFAYPDRRIAIEVDGYRWHAGRRRWERDLARRNALTALGWRVLHVTAADIEQRPGDMLAIVRAALGGSPVG
jgi:very-short-patch-repair endonuclease